MESREGFDSVVKIPEDYFRTMSEKDYSNIYKALVREFFQNSVDAGAKNFTLFFDFDSAELSIYDDGCGMDKRVILEKLLVMGGSGKTEGKTVGAFGHAKILIYFSWPGYTIHTGNLLVTGKSNRFNVEKVSEHMPGTLSVLKMGSELQKVFDNVGGYFKSCNTDCKVHICSYRNDRFYSYVEKQFHKKDKLICSDNFFEYFTVDLGGNEVDTFDRKKVFVQTQGITMFHDYVYSLENPIIAVPLKHTYTIFNQNRDSLKQDASDQFSKFKTHLSVDSVSTTAEIASLKDGRVENGEDDEEVKTFHYNYGYLFHNMSKKESFALFKNLGLKRIEGLHRFLVELGKEAGIETKFGFTKSSRGLSASVEGDPLICINLADVFNHANQRERTYSVLEIFAHEATHFLISKSGNDNYLGYHNEYFVLNMHSMRARFWDLSKYNKLFLACLKSVSV